jgi:hypothetical protein
LRGRMSAVGPKQTSVFAPRMSAFGAKADIASLRYQNLVEEPPRLE